MNTAERATGKACPVAIVGGGISGLSAGWEIYRQGGRAIILEAGSRPGGVVQTESAGDFIFELGPDSFLTRKTAAADLCHELGLSAALTGGAMAAPVVHILRHGRLHRLPAGWQMLAPGRVGPALTTPLLSPATKLRLAWRWLRPAPPRRPRGEESVEEFVNRQFGPEVVHAIVEPLLAGVYGGNASELSLAAVMPELARLEASGRPLLRELRKKRPAKNAAAPPPTFTTLGRGMGSLVEALAAQLPAGWLRCNATVTRLAAAPDGAGWRLRLADGEELAAAAVLLALPAGSAARLLAPVDGALAAALAAIPYSTAVTVNLAYDRETPLPEGSGLLVARGERVSMLACTFTHRKFPHRAPPGGMLLRLFYRGEPADDMAAVARRELETVLGLRQAPRAVRVARWPQALAQYTVGHAARLEAVAAGLARHGGLELAGNAYRGVGVPDCIQSGRAAARRLIGA